MKYFFDTEFLEGEQTIYQWGLKTDTWLTIASIGFILLGAYVWFLGANLVAALFFLFPAIILFGISVPKTPPTVDLISIGIVSEDGREYYAISKDFNLKEVWNRYQMKQVYGDQRNRYPYGVREYWIRENVLRPIFKELSNNETNGLIFNKRTHFTYINLKRLIKKYGKPNKQIASEILAFTLDPSGEGFDDWLGFSDDYFKALKDSSVKPMPEFYAYYADYDWVAFCWLFGRMIDLPKSFPMYCKDLKQIFDDKVSSIDKKTSVAVNKKRISNEIKSHRDYPKQVNEHNALADARWNFELYKFLETL